MQSNQYPERRAHLQALIVTSLGLFALTSAAAQSNISTLTRKSLSSGTYTDKKTKSRHMWQVNGAHTLLWDGAPYLPVGGTFSPQSFASDTPSAWLADVNALQSLKAKGIHDVIIWPDKALPDIPTASVQRLIDYLEANEFHYGLSFGQALSAPLTGYVVKPSIYRYEDTHDLTALWQVSDVDRALYFLVDGGNDSRFIRCREATVHDGVASAPLDVPDSVARPVALLLPHKTLSATPHGNLPDLWTQFDGYRDRLLNYLEPIKFGAGLRFLLDPLARHLGITGEADSLIPDSDAFRLEWESYLYKTYNTPDEVRSRWLLTDNFKTMQDLARLIPLWNNRRGLPYLFDPGTGRIFHVEQTEAQISSWWDDYRHSRDQSIAYYMNGIADTLKHLVADVPVVYTWTQQEGFFSGADPAAGFDGLAVTTTAQDPNRLARVTGLAYSEAEQSSRAMWLIASEIGPNLPVPSRKDGAIGSKPTEAASPAGATGYTTNRDMENDLTDLRRIGFKGMFVNALQPSASDSRASGNWLSAPETLDWLHSFANGLTADAGLANFSPRVLYYPEERSGPARTTSIPGATGVYWLPANISGKPLTWWPTFVGYVMQRDLDQPEETVLMSISGPRKTRIFAPDITKVQVRSSEGTPIPLKILTKTSGELTIDSAPMIFTSGGHDIIPDAPAKDAIEQLELLDAMAHLQKTNSLNMGQDIIGDVEINQARMYYHQKDFGMSYAAARQMMDKMADLVKPYFWIEGESTPAQNFTEVAANAEASGGQYLRLNTPNPPHPIPAYGARYTFDVPNDGDYRIWIAGTLPGPETSPFTWYIDNQAPQEPISPVPQGPLYLQNRFGWYQLGKVRLEKGQRNLSIKITERAAATNLYSFSIDTIMVMPAIREFVPNATIPPIPIDPDTARAFLKSRPPKPKGKKQQ